MLQVLDGKVVYVIQINSWPITLPITGLTEDEAAYEKLLDCDHGQRHGLVPKRTTGDYARALEQAIKDGLVTEAGQYGIEVLGNGDYQIYHIVPPTSAALIKIQEEIEAFDQDETNYTDDSKDLTPDAKTRRDILNGKLDAWHRAFDAEIKAVQEAQQKGQ